MSRDKKGLLREVVNWRTAFAGMVLVATGILFLVIASRASWVQSHTILASLAMQLGGLFIVSASITVVWDLVGKRAFAEELLEKADISREMTEAGVVKISASFHGDAVEWSEFFETANRVDLFFSYGRTWRGAHLEDLRQFISRSGVKLRVILPDPDAGTVMDVLALRYGKTAPEIRQRVLEAVQYFDELRNADRRNQAKVEIWLFPGDQTFSFYLSNRMAVLALYSHGRQQVPVPTIVCRRGGSIHEYLVKEVKAMIEGKPPLAKRFK